MKEFDSYYMSSILLVNMHEVAPLKGKTGIKITDA